VIAVNVVRALFRSVVRQHSFPPLNTLALVHRLSPLLSRDRTFPAPPRICPLEIGHLPPAGVGDGVRYVVRNNVGDGDLSGWRFHAEAREGPVQIVARPPNLAVVN